MPIVPDQPFPKAAGNPIRSKDWNDLVYETQRLDNAKVNKTGDAMTGPLTIQAALNQAALGVGTASPAPSARLHVVDGANPTVLRVQSTASFGKARLELWSDPQGSGSEWRPGYLETLDLGNFTGGLSFVNNGIGSANRTGSVEALRLVKGRAGFGVNDPGFRIDVADRIRLRQNPEGHSAGLWLFQTTPNADRAFIGMVNDNAVGLYGQSGAGWSLSMDVTTGNVGIRTQPEAAGGAALVVNGRVKDSKLRQESTATNTIFIQNTTNNTAWNNLTPSLTVPSPGANFLILFHMGAVQALGVNAAITHAQVETRLLVDNVQQAYTMNEYHANGWELRPISLQTLLFLAAGSHSIVVQWSVRSQDAHAGNPVRGGVSWYGDTRSLISIEL